MTQGTCAVPGCDEDANEEDMATGIETCPKHSDEWTLERRAQRLARERALNVVRTKKVRHKGLTPD